MPEARYFLPDHPELKGDYSRDDLRLLLKGGKISRSDMVLDDETGLAHLLGALLASPYYLTPNIERRRVPKEEDDEEEPGEGEEEEKKQDPPRQGELPFSAGLDDEPEPPEPSEPVERHMEFRATTPLRQWENPALENDHYGDESEEEEEFEDEDEDEDGFHEEEAEAHEAPDVRVVAPLPQLLPLTQAGIQREETLLYHGHPTWLSYPKTLLAFVLLSAVSILCQRLHLGLTGCVTAAALALLCLAFVALDRMSTEYFISTRRVEVESGLLGRSTKEIRIEDIRAIDVTQRGFNAILAVGTLDFVSSAGGQAEVRFANVYRPHRLKQIVRDLQV